MNSMGKIPLKLNLDLRSKYMIKNPIRSKNRQLFLKNFKIEKRLKDEVSSKNVHYTYWLLVPKFIRLLSRLS